MDNGTIERLHYFKGQLLTAQDFEDQQRYHIQKLDQLVQRFSRGIIRGLNVVCSPPDPANPDDFEAFKIQEGFAVDQNGRAIVVPQEGLRVNVATFNADEPYLSLIYHEKPACAVHSPCELPAKYNRIQESVDYRWDSGPNINDAEGARVTVARIRPKNEDEAGIHNEKFCTDHVIIEVEQPGSPFPPIRTDAGLVGEEQLERNSVTSDKIRDGAVTTDELANNAVTTPKIADQAVEEGKIANDAITSFKLRNDAVTGAKIMNGAVEESKIATNAVTQDKIRDGAVTLAKLAAGLTIPPGGPAGGDLTGTYPNPDIANGAVHTPKIADNAVTTIKISNAAVTEAKIADNAITPNKIDNGAVTDAKIAAGAVITSKLANNAVTSAKIINGAVTTSKLENGSVTTDKIADGAVTQAKLAAGVTIPPGGLAGGDLTGTYPNPDIADGAVTAAKIADRAVNSAKLALSVQEETIGSIAAGAVDDEFPWPGTFSESDFDRPMIGYVIPTTVMTDGDLSWKMAIRRVTATEFQIVFRITNHSTSVAAFVVRLLTVA